MSTARDDAQMHIDLITAYLAHLQAEASPRTCEAYTRVLRRAHRDLPHGVVTATEPELASWLGSVGRLPDTRRVYRQAIAGLHRWLHAREITDYDPTILLPRWRAPRRLPRPLPPDQLARVLTTTRQPIRLWCTVMAYTGARCVELARLRREDIGEQVTRLHGKGDRDRTVPTHAVLWATVRDLPPGPLVTGVAGRPKYLSELVATECDRIGLPDVTAHRLRHTLATALLSETGDLRLVQELLGHASPATTAVYAAVLPGRLNQAVAGLPDWTARSDGAVPGSAAHHPSPPAAGSGTDPGCCGTG